MENKSKPKIGITLGDFNGIGPEVILKTLADPRVLNFCTPFIYGSAPLLRRYRKLFNIENLSFQQLKAGEPPVPKKISVVSCWEEDYEIQPGTPSPESGRGALLSLQSAVGDLKNGLLEGIVTAPIDKDNIQSEEFRFPGHTEYFTTTFGAPESLMFLVGQSLRVATVTGHLPLKEVSSALSVPLLLQKLTILLKSLKEDFGLAKPRVAVLGLNPHAGEKGLLGTEEGEIIFPALKELKEKGHLVFGPYPADGFFGNAQYTKFDATLSMYHDQGLIPFKTLAFETGVNFTAGLPIVRTSPDHGTAYDLAGKNLANESSFREALFLACDIIRRRQSNRFPR
ncbi:4-hydroxythreonine-4-phosphate dehydrogenase PdxA [soil metagenome]